MLALVCLGECVRNCDLVGVGRPVGPARGAVAVHQLAQTFGRDGVDRVKHDANVRINGNKQLILPMSFTRLDIPRPADSAWPGGSRQEAGVIMNILIIDNYDSFVYNIVGLLQRERAAAGGIRPDWDVVRNDVIPFGSLDRYDAIILSPGPGVPGEAGGLMRLVAEASHVPMLGICLGHQAIAQHYGARLCQLAHPRHGHPSVLTDIDPADPLIGRCGDGRGVTVGRYHSWTVDETSLPSCLHVTSRDEEGHIMSMRHESLPTFGVQFHPESVITTCGRELLHDFIVYAGECSR